MTYNVDYLLRLLANSEFDIFLLAPFKKHFLLPIQFGLSHIAPAHFNLQLSEENPALQCVPSKYIHEKLNLNVD